MGVIRRLSPHGPHWADTLPLRYPADYLDQLAIREAERILDHSQRIKCADGIYYVDRRLPFAITDYGGITLTTAQKCLWTPGATNPTILPANYWTLGKTLRLTANLKWTAVANTNAITAGMQYGAADAAAANVITQAGTGVSSTTTFDVIAVGYATCRAVGTSGTLSMWGYYLFPSGLIVAGIMNMPVAGVTVVSTIDTTVGTNGLSFQALRASVAGDTVLATDILLEAMN